MRLMRKRRASAPGHTVWQPTGSQIIIAVKVIKRKTAAAPAMGNRGGKTVRDLAEHMVQKEEIRRIMDIVVSYEREWIRIFQKNALRRKHLRRLQRRWILRRVP